MRIISNEKQKDNLAKLLYDFCKIIFAVAVVGSFAQPEKFNVYVIFIGILTSFAFFIFANYIDKKQIK